MICPFCNDYEATIHLTQISNGKKHEIHICEFCAKEKGLLSTQLIDFSELLVGMPESTSKATGPQESSSVDVKILGNVPNPDSAENKEIGKALLHFHNTGRFKSPEEYDLLFEQVSSLLEKIHGTCQHMGKKPKSYEAQATVNEKIETLKKELDVAIREEWYEKAADVRDRIRDLERQRTQLAKSESRN